MIELRAIETGDLQLMQKWRNSDNVMPNCRQYRPLSLEDMGSWYLKLSKNKDYNLTNDMFLITYQNHPIGVGGLVRIDWRNRKAEVSFYVADAEDCTKEIISEALLCISKYAFTTLQMHKIYFPVYSFNPYLEIYEQIMPREYVAKQEYYWDGKYHDRIILTKYGHLQNNNQV